MVGVEVLLLKQACPEKEVTVDGETWHAGRPLQFARDTLTYLVAIAKTPHLCGGGLCDHTKRTD
jgi:hypothetical protein